MRVLDDVGPGAWIGDRLGEFGTVGGTVGTRWPSIVRVRPADGAATDTVDGLAQVVRHLPGEHWVGAFWEGYAEWRPQTWGFVVGTTEPMTEEEHRVLAERARAEAIAAVDPAVAHASDHGPFLELPFRRYFLAELAAAELHAVPRAPNLLWPDSRDWLVAVEVDADFALVGASHPVTRILVDDGALVVDDVHPDTPLGDLIADDET